MNRAYSTFVVKTIDEDARIIKGIASTPVTDRVEDIVEPKGGVHSGYIPFLWQHESNDAAIGEILSEQATDEGIPVTVRVAKDDVPGLLKDRLDYAWRAIKLKLVRGLSIGFKPLEAEPIKGTFGMRFKRWEWLELSAVTIPANVQATITAVKSYAANPFTPDVNSLAASGTQAENVEAIPSPRVRGRSVRIDTSPPKAKGAMTIQERITAFEATRQAKTARLSEITEKAGTEGRSKDAAEREEFDTLRDEIKSIDQELVDLREMETINKAQLKAVDGGGTKAAADSRESKGASNGGSPVKPATPVVGIRPNVEKGMGFVRKAIAIMNAKGNKFEAIEYAKARWGDQAHEVVQEIKAAVAAGTTTDATWAGPLAVVTPLAGEFLELLRPRTLLGQLQGRVRNVPFNVSVPAVTSGGSVAWVGQGSAKPLTALALSTVTVGFAKAAGIVVLADELVRLSTPSAEGVVRDTMVDTMRVFMDTQFIDATVAAVANVNPASITNGVTGTAASGTTEAAARTDLRALVATFATNNIGLEGVVLIMSETMAFTLGTMVNALGQPAFPGLSIAGGSILGMPVVVSNVVGAQIVAVHAPSVLYADEGATEIDVSREASVQMDSAPDNPTNSTTVMVSLWQRNLIGLRFERHMNWIKARANVVQRIHTVAYA